MTTNVLQMKCLTAAGPRRLAAVPKSWLNKCEQGNGNENGAVNYIKKPAH